MAKADSEPSVLARMLGSMLRSAREIVELTYDEAAARLGCEADWLIRVETGFTSAGPEEVARILVEYGVREANVADTMIDLARRVASPPSWLTPHLSRLRPANRDVFLVEAESTLARIHSFQLIPYLVQTEGYFRHVAPYIFMDCDVDEEWDLLSHRQTHRPAGITRLLEVIIDEQAFAPRSMPHPIMAEQIRSLLALSDSPHATVRIIPKDAPFYEDRTFTFDILSFAGTEDRIGVCYYPVLGPELAPADLYKIWNHITTTTAATPAQSRTILEQHLDALR